MTGIDVSKYRSTRTGMTVVIAAADSPVVNGYFCLATEAFTEDGLPHTLEHLIFLGSEDYPYKSVLDFMANRCLADRTNAWTDTDHTCYTVYTAGTDGFVAITPIYVDHILHPLLRDGDFLTEVHHINGKGDDAGVVYSEMKGIENSGSNLLYFKVVDGLYPGNSSYEVQTGGKVANLRKSTTNEKVRRYHQKFYRPENLYLTITGRVNPDDIFQALGPIEEKILKRRNFGPPQPINPRPFSTEYPPLNGDINSEAPFPSNEMRFGRMALGWRLPFKLKDGISKIHAMKMAASYLTSTAVSPLQKVFVEVSSPLATDVDIDFLLFSDPAVYVDFEDVPVRRLNEVEHTFNRVIKSVLNNKDQFNMNRMQTLCKYSGRRLMGPPRD